MRVETGRGVLTLDLKLANDKVEQVTVNMGEPILEPAKIPFDIEKPSKAHENTSIESRSRRAMS